jgi:hypothetical protein
MIRLTDEQWERMRRELPVLDVGFSQFGVLSRARQGWVCVTSRTSRGVKLECLRGVHGEREVGGWDGRR